MLGVRGSWLAFLFGDSFVGGNVVRQDLVPKSKGVKFQQCTSSQDFFYLPVIALMLRIHKAQLAIIRDR